MSDSMEIKKLCGEILDSVQRFHALGGRLVTNIKIIRGPSATFSKIEFEFENEQAKKN